MCRLQVENLAGESRTLSAAPDSTRKRLTSSREIRQSEYFMSSGDGHGKLEFGDSVEGSSLIDQNLTEIKPSLLPKTKPG